MLDPHHFLGGTGALEPYVKPVKGHGTTDAKQRTNTGARAQLIPRYIPSHEANARDAQLEY